VGRPADDAVCEGWQDVHADSPAKCVPHLEQCANHVNHRSWAPFYSCYDAFFGPESCYDQKGEGKKVHLHGWDCWKYLIEGREATQACDFFLCQPTTTRSNPQRYTKMCVISSHNSAGILSLLWCRIIKLSPAPNDMFTYKELELHWTLSRLIDGMASKNCWDREILQHLISPCTTSVCKRKVSPHNFLKERIVWRKWTVLLESYNASETIIKWASDLFRGAHSEYQYLS